MSAKAAMRKRSQAVLNRPGGLRRRHFRSARNAAAEVGFAGKVSKTARKSGVR